MWEECVFNNKVIVVTKINEPFTILIPCSNSMSTYNMGQFIIVAPNFGVQVAHDNNNITLGDRIVNGFQLAIKAILFADGAFLRWGVTLNNCDIPDFTPPTVAPRGGCVSTCRI